MARSTQKRYVRKYCGPFMSSADLIAMADVEGYDLAAMLQVSNNNRED